MNKTEANLPSVDLTCEVFGQVDFAVSGGGLSGIYTSHHRNCTSLDPRYQKYSAFLATAAPNQVAGCPPTAFSGSADLVWVNRDTLTLEQGTAAFEVSLATATFSLTVTSGPLTGDRIISAVVPVPGGVVTCPNGVPIPERLLINGQGTFVRL
ncbi:hypothetical protein IU452_02445 [Nocardia transvalensis]|nr:hypothetical protein [Nocardia transvalensis]